MNLPRFFVWLAAVAFATAEGIAAASAQGGICVELETRLARIEQGGFQPDANEARAFDASVAQQRNEIDRAMAEARRARCTGGLFLFQRQPEAKCPELMATIDRMQGNLQRLMQDRAQFAGDPSSAARQRNEILRSLAMNGCGPSLASNGGFIPDAPPRGLFASLFGGPQQRTWGNDQYFMGESFGTYRTLCVRTCDGFYFPISFSTIPAKFPIDASTCQQMCPGTEALLYTHRNPGEDANAMVSLYGEPYALLPTAFRFRQTYDKSCTCGSASANLPIEFSDFSDGAPAPPDANWRVANPLAMPDGPTAPMPNRKPVELGDDPETAANRRGRFVPGVAAAQQDVQPAAVTADGRRIRVVGPAAYLPQ